MEYQNILLELEPPVAILTINRPEQRNSIDPAMIREIGQALGELSSNRDVKVLILTGSGGKTFAAGADIKKLRERTFLETLAPGLQGLCNAIEQFEKPVIAAVNGYALGGGCELALACDIRIAAEEAKFGFPELNLGLIPGAGGTQRLTRLVGEGKAKELIFTGEPVTAAEAERIGLVNKVVPADKLMDTAKEMALKIASKAPLALMLAKKAINVNEEAPKQVGLVVEKLIQAVLESTEDKREGTAAFIEKRAPVFKGR